MFAVGDIVKHKLTGDVCMIIRVGKEQFVIRTPNYREHWVYDYELEKVENK